MHTPAIKHGAPLAAMVCCVVIFAVPLCVRAPLPSGMKIDELVITYISIKDRNTSLNPVFATNNFLVRFYESRLQTHFVSVYDDKLHGIPAASQRGVCTLPPFKSRLAAPRSALMAPLCLHHSTVAMLRGRDARRHESRQHALRADGSLSAHAHKPLCELYCSSSHPRRHTHSVAHTRTPCGGFGNPSSDPNVSSQSRTKNLPPSSAAASSGARSFPASLFKSGLKRQADLHTTYTLETYKSVEKLGEFELRECGVEHAL